MRLEENLQVMSNGIDGTRSHAELWRGAHVDIVVVGSLTNPEPKNQEMLGLYSANHLSRNIAIARENGQRVAFNMATGSSPERGYETLARMTAGGQVDLSDVIFFGHEQAWVAQDVSLNYERQRLAILEKLGIYVQPITSPEGVSGDTILGNYIPMNLLPPPNESLDRDGYPEKLLEVAQHSVAQYDKILAALLLRNEIVTVSQYGVGPDSHGGGELQLYHLWPNVWPSTMGSFLMPIKYYSFERGLWMLPSKEGVPKGDNVLFGQQKAKGVHFLQGLGRQFMAKPNDAALHIFNNTSKSTAFTQTLEYLREISTGLTVSDPGAGETMISSFLQLADEFSKDGFVLPDNVQNCNEITSAILNWFREQQLSYSNDTDKPYYEELWRLLYGYFGNQTPVGRMIVESVQAGGSVELVTTADVVRGTQYEMLAKK